MDKEQETVRQLSENVRFRQPEEVFVLPSYFCCDMHYVLFTGSCQPLALNTSQCSFARNLVRLVQLVQIQRARFSMLRKQRGGLTLRFGSLHSTGFFAMLLVVLPCFAVVFMLVFIRYTLAAVVTKQLTSAQAMHHKRVVMEVALSAKAKSLSPLLGVLYDEVARLMHLIQFLVCVILSFRSGSTGMIYLES